MRDATGASSDGSIDSDMLGDISGHGNVLINQKVDDKEARGRVMGFISEWITSVSFIKGKAFEKKGNTSQHVD